MKLESRDDSNPSGGWRAQPAGSAVCAVLASVGATLSTPGLDLAMTRGALVADKGREVELRLGDCIGLVNQAL